MRGTQCGGVLGGREGWKGAPRMQDPGKPRSGSLDGGGLGPQTDIEGQTVTPEDKGRGLG